MKTDDARTCQNCGHTLVRRPLEDLANWRRRKHCDRQCAAAALWKKRKGVKENTKQFCI